LAAGDGQGDIAENLAVALHTAQDDFDVIQLSSTNSHVLSITARVSGTTNRDVSPLAHTIPNVVFNAATDSTTLLLAGKIAGHQAAASGSSNTTAIASSLFNLSAAKKDFNGLRITMSKNDSTSLMAAGASLTLTGNSGTLNAENGTAVDALSKGGAGNQSAETAGGATYGNGIALVAGTNAPSAAMTSSVLDYVAGSGEIESTSTTEGNDTNRTGWLAGS